MTGRLSAFLAGVLTCGALAPDVGAQPLGTFRWQLLPFCNVITVAITQNGAVYRLEGTDDQCGNGADAASVTGTAFPNPDGTIGFGLNVVTTPGGRPLHVDAEITIGTFSGTWRDSAGAAGTFAFTPGAGSGGSLRPLPSAPVPSTIQLRADGGFVAGGAVGQGAIPASGPGARMMWYPGKAAFRAGRVSGPQWDDASVGLESVAFGRGSVASGPLSTASGFFTTASGLLSTAMGATTTASGENSTAMGNFTRAIGINSVAIGVSTMANGSHSMAMGANTTADGFIGTAMGSGTTASGAVSTAMGSGTTASGSSSTAMGLRTTASGAASFAAGTDSLAGGTNALALGDQVRADGSGSVALGTRASANANGAFAFGDRSTTSQLFATPNAFAVRAAGGVNFYSNAALTLGVRLASNGTDWTSLSDVRAKHRFRALDGDAVLAKIARMPVTEWSYKEQDGAIRHIGPTAQDFHAAFGLGEDPLRIGTLDADGVALAGVRALESRSRQQGDEMATLKARSDWQSDALATLTAEIARLRELVAELTCPRH